VFLTAGAAAPRTQMSVLSGVEQDAVERYFVRVPNLRWHRALELLGALVIDSGAVANLAGRPRGIVVDYLLKTDV
jgi:hypothetical protein